MAKDKDTKVTGDLKVGSKVTIQYQMKATAVEVKADDKKKGRMKRRNSLSIIALKKWPRPPEAGPFFYIPASLTVS